MTDTNKSQEITGRPNLRLRNIRWALLNANERLGAENRRAAAYPFVRRVVLVPTFLMLRIGLALVTNLLSLPIYATRNMPARFTTYGRRREETYTDSYVRFKNSARWTIGIFLVTIVAIVSAIITASLLRGSVAPSTATTPVFHIGILKRVSTLDPLIISFKADLATRGYAEGKRVIYDEPVSSGDEAALEAAADEFVNKKYDLILAVGDMAAQAVKKTTLKINIPAVFYANFNPVENGLIKSYANSENNFVGVGEGAMVKRQIELLQRIAPNADTVGVMSVSADGTNQSFIRALKTTAIGEELTVRTETIATVEDIPTALNALVAAGATAVYLAPSALTAPHLEFIAQEALTRKMILVGNSAKNAEAGALFALMADLDSTGRQLAAQADQIFRGILPSNISSQFPQAILLALNLKTAMALNLTIPADVIERADVRY